MTTRLWIVLIWFVSLCVSSHIANPAHASPSAPHGQQESTSAHHSGASLSILAHPQGLPLAGGGSSATSPSRPEPSGWDIARSGFVLPEGFPSYKEIQAVFEQFWSGDRYSARQGLVFWAGRKAPLPKGDGRLSDYSYGLDANQEQAQGYADTLSLGDKVYYTLKNIRGQYLQTWTQAPKPFKIHWDEASAVFDRLSAAMASMADKEVWVYGSPEAFGRTDTAWAKIERPILEKRVYQEPSNPDGTRPIKTPKAQTWFGTKRISRARLEITGPIRNPRTGEIAGQSSSVQSQAQKLPPNQNTPPADGGRNGQPGASKPASAGETQPEIGQLPEPKPQGGDPSGHSAPPPENPLAPQSQPGSRGGRGGRNRGRGGRGGGSRGGRKSQPQPRAAKFAINNKQNILRTASSSPSPKSVGSERGYAKPQSAYRGIDYNTLPGWALDEIYLRLIFSDLNMADDALYDRSDMANLIRDRIVS